MSPRRRLLVVGVVVLVLLGAGIAVVLSVRSGGGTTAAGPADQDRPGPVLLVPGYGGNRASLSGLAARLRSAGRAATVLTLEGDGTGDLNRQVDVLARAVDTEIAAGAPSVDVVGYSAGGVVAGLWAARDADAAAKARRIVTLGSPLHGTRVAALGSAFAPDACPDACRQLAPGSSLLAELDRAPRTVPWLSAWTTGDQTVVPPDTARLDGATNVELQRFCPGATVTHSGLPTDPAVTGLVRRALSTAAMAAAPADCGTLRAAA